MMVHACQEPRGSETANMTSSESLLVSFHGYPGACCALYSLDILALRGLAPYRKRSRELLGLVSVTEVSSDRRFLVLCNRVG
jgi:hypothetical protein